MPVPSINSLTITTAEWYALSPIIIVGLGILFSLLVGTINFPYKRNRKLPVFFVSLLSLFSSLYASIEFRNTAPLKAMQNIVLFDAFSSYFFILLLVAAILIVLAGFHYMEKEEIHFSEYYPILLSAVFGMMCMVITIELVTLFIALEIMSLAIYVLVGLRRFDKYSNEAAAKYFVMGGVASAVYLYGVALIYGALNTTNLTEISLLLRESSITNITLSNPILLLGTAFLFVGFLFKIAVVPFHMWTPDVYEGAPTVVTSFMSTALKAAVLGAFIRITLVFLGSEKDVADSQYFHKLFYEAIWWLSLATMVVGNFAALLQQNVKRMLAYSAIAHTGYLLLGILVGSKVGYSSLLIYLFPYILMNIGAFTILAIFTGKMDKDATIDSFSGIGFKYPIIGAAMAVFLFSLAGLPPTGGFIAKYFLFTSALEAGEILLVLLAVLTSLVSVYYYLRVVIYMYMREENSRSKSSLPVPLCVYATATILLCVVAILKIGIFPGDFINFAKNAAIF